MSECNHNCESCEQSCGEKSAFLKEKLNPKSKVKKVIGIVSGKGGVGKSTVTSLVASALSSAGKRVAILDADVTGPSIPQAFGVHERTMATTEGVYPAVTQSGIQLASVNLLLEDETQPVVWRGPVIAGAVKQFWTDFIWEDVDVMVIDMPPGTGDVPLTVFQSIPVDGIIVVSSPQQLVSTIVAKAVNMAEMMRIPIIGLIENYSYFECPSCKERAYIFGESHINDIALRFGLDILCKLPIDPTLAKACDEGKIETFSADYLKGAFDKLNKFI